MKAAILTQYGSPRNLQVTEVEQPQVGANEVLVKVHAASINDWDWCIVKGSPFYIRLLCGLLKPKVRIAGVDIAGRVEAVGDAVKTFQPGDTVYGDLSDCGLGGFAEYASIPEASLSRMPAKADFIQAAAIPHAATLALQGLRDVGQLEPTDTLLINGAGGGVGTIGLQIARSLGVGHVVGVDHASKLDMMRSLGYDEVIDYTQCDFTSAGKTYDLILDTKTNCFPLKYLKALKPNGSYVTVGGQTLRLIQTLLLGRAVRMFSTKKLRIVALKPNKGLGDISAMIDNNEITPITEGPYPLEDIAEAVQRFGDGLHQGKLIISMDTGERLQ
ncbi:NAD(P)-dependent alcohol dehydrogenase [Rubellicoccus peritrichatus]|uniref:NAD(P)-dependent alcohol dehydrogenase n=1 Tax=Rubellicoccus peritrichatus TaxID=3080537 RepID=A0AAQ3LAZ2_9BACT|nr:NAD(P)-dependent alcohol dehydrogenase [Puniceicoccus sp. CR14]WOO40168.1 NAD(P)-dependent alcohol dehydrogenase [Puniceicoccus sp. CR14]